MQQALFAGGLPLATFLGLWLYVRAENTSVDPASRRRLALVASALFLFLPLMAPPVFDGGRTAELQTFRAAVSATCALGLAIAAIRTAPARKVAPAIMILLSGTILILLFLDYLGR